MAKIKINPEILHWAMERSEIEPEQIAQKVHVKPQKIQQWLSGQTFPTFSQLRTLAKVLYLPVGYFFLKKPPKLKPALADFRALPDTQKGKFSVDLQAVLEDALRKRDWYREWRMQQETEPLPFVGKFTPHAEIKEVVREIKNVLKIKDYPAEGTHSWSEHLRKLIDLAEKAGVLIFMRGVVGSNNKRPLNVQEFRGFTIVDNIAPIIFINAQDSIAGRIFTFAHEFAHLLTGTSGVSNPEMTPAAITKDLEEIEVYCNQVAAEFLVPEPMMRAFWDNRNTTIKNVENIANIFKVSSFVALYRSYDLKFIEYQDLLEIYQVLEQNIKIEKDKTGGGDFYRTFLNRNSKRFVRELVFAVAEEQTLYLEASKLLNVKPSTLDKIRDHLVLEE